MKRYFCNTLHFSPKNEEPLFIKIKNGLYKNSDTGELYRKRLLYDFGWGQETGFELLPQLSFDELIKLVEMQLDVPKKKFWQKYTEAEMSQTLIYRNNLYGAVAVIMQDHIEEFIDFLSDKIETDYFDDPDLCKNYRCFSFDSKKDKEEGKIPGGILTRSYEDVLRTYPKWNEISEKVINQVYREENKKRRKWFI